VFIQYFGWDVRVHLVYETDKFNQLSPSLGECFIVVIWKFLSLLLILQLLGIGWYREGQRMRKEVSRLVKVRTQYRAIGIYTRFGQ